MHEMVAQQRLQREILDLATQISTGHDGARRALDTYLFRLPTTCGANVISPNCVTQLMRIHLESLQRITRKRLADNALGDGQARKRHRCDETQDRGGESRLAPTDASNSQRAREHDEQSRQNPDSIANQCRDILIGWLSEKADDDDFKPHDEKDLVEKACAHLKTQILGKKAGPYYWPCRFGQAITSPSNLWAQFQALRQDPATRDTRSHLMLRGIEIPAERRQRQRSKRPASTNAGGEGPDAGDDGRPPADAGGLLRGRPRQRRRPQRRPRRARGTCQRARERTPQAGTASKARTSAAVAVNLKPTGAGANLLAAGAGAWP